MSKNKLIGNIKKYYEYAFTEAGEVVVKNKSNGTIKQYSSVEEFVRNVSYTDTLISQQMSHKWNKKKQTLNDKKITKDPSLWESLVKLIKK